MNASIENVSRRGLLKNMLSAGASLIAVRYPSDTAFADEVARSVIDKTPLHPSAYVGLETDGTMYIVAHRSEMGTSIRTSSPMILADELDADWSRVKIIQAIGDPRYGSQGTDGSKSVRDFYNPLREGGATARLMLIRAAAQQWGIRRIYISGGCGVRQCRRDAAGLDRHPVRPAKSPGRKRARARTCPHRYLARASRAMARLLRRTAPSSSRTSTTTK